MGSGGLHRAVVEGLSFGAEIGRFVALRIMCPGSYMVGLRKNLTFGHQWAINWQSLEENEIFEFRTFSAPNQIFSQTHHIGASVHYA